MKFKWNVTNDTSQQVKCFLKERGISKGLLAKIKFQGGEILVNQVRQNALFPLTIGDEIEITIPNEKEHETVLVDKTPLIIVFEDAHFLVVEKPSGVASIPSQYHPNGTMANRVKAYFIEKDYPDKVIHVVTRLDRDTTGLMLFAKHGYAHALLDKELRAKRVTKIYKAIISGNTDKLTRHGMIEAPIGRDRSSLLKRKVIESGQLAKTEYWLINRNEDYAVVDIQLHTGKTHQIRVHFESIGCPLLGDEMYNGAMNQGIKRQALHCCQLKFIHPFTKKEMCLSSTLPNDMENFMCKFSQRGNT